MRTYAIKRFCPNGHDKDLLGRTSRSRCAQCERDQYQARRDAQLHLRSRRGGGLKVEFAPLENFLTLHREPKLSVLFNGTSLRRWRAEGMPLGVADEVACRLGYHPSEIWGQEFFK